MARSKDWMTESPPTLLEMVGLSMCVSGLFCVSLVKKHDPAPDARTACIRDYYEEHAESAASFLIPPPNRRWTSDHNIATVEAAVTICAKLHPQTIR